MKGIIARKDAKTAFNKNGFDVDIHNGNGSAKYSVLETFKTGKPNFVYKALLGLAVGDTVEFESDDSGQYLNKIKKTAGAPDDGSRMPQDTPRQGGYNNVGAAVGCIYSKGVDVLIACHAFKENSTPEEIALQLVQFNRLIERYYRETDPSKAPEEQGAQQ